MDLLRPDAIVMDETFAGLGYDHHPRRQARRPWLRLSSTASFAR